MSASSEQREHAVQRAGKIFTIIKDAARLGERCPTNKFLAERFDCGTSCIVNAIHFLESCGMIEVERMSDTRIVTVCATGSKTAGKSGKPHWTARFTKQGEMFGGQHDRH